MDVEFLSIIALFGILGTIIFIDRKNIEFGIVFIRRTKKGKEWIKRFAEKHRKFFKFFGNVSILMAFLLSVFGFYYLFQWTGVRLILPKVFPGEVSEGVERVVFFMPLWYWVIGLFVIIVPHELFHGFLFALEKIKIKSTGLLLFLIFPGGFVEPDEEQFKNSKPITRMRVAAVGSITNVCIFILLLFLGLFLTNLFYEEKGMIVFPINNTSYPAKQTNLTGIITEINGNQIRNVGDFQMVIENQEPGDS
jgi:membrane-associated protease RseP (regulator of RpoE activity)